LKSKDPKLRKIFRTFLDEKRANRHFGRDGEWTSISGLEQTQMAGSNSEVETILLLWKAYEALRRLNREIKPTGKSWDEFTIVHSLAPREEVTSKDVSKYITQKIYRRILREELHKNVNGEQHYSTGRFFYSLHENSV
jgi:hypothetical protein